jgi:hypothetical protein
MRSFGRVADNSADDVSHAQRSGRFCGGSGVAQIAIGKTWLYVFNVQKDPFFPDRLWLTPCVRNGVRKATDYEQIVNTSGF